MFKFKIKAVESDRNETIWRASQDMVGLTSLPGVQGGRYFDAVADDLLILGVHYQQPDGTGQREIRQPLSRHDPLPSDRVSTTTIDSFVPLADGRNLS